MNDTFHPVNINFSILFQFFSDIFYTSIHIFKDRELVNQSLPSSLSPDQSPFFLNPQLIDQIAVKELYFCSDPFFPDIHYGCLQYESFFIIIGPYSSQKLAAIIPGRYQKKYIPNSKNNYFIPVITDAQIIKIIDLISFLLTGTSETSLQNFSPETLDEHFINNSSLDVKRNNYHYDNLENIPHYPYEYELELLKCLQRGDYDSVKKNQEKMNTANIGDFYSSNIEKKRYEAIIAAAIFPRQAIYGGVNTYEAYEMTDIYLKECGKCTTIEEYDRLSQTIIYNVCKAVRQAQAVKTENILVEKCKTYIYQNLTKDIHLDMIAEELKINPSYLSRIFSQVESISLVKYITKKKTEAASDMLKHSDYSIAQISEYLGFSSQSYFATVFKKETGISPSKFRKINRIF